MPSQDDAHATLDELIAAKQQAGDGSLQIVMAIASITDLVTVDTTATPFTFKPANLPSLTFNDPAVGINDGQMPIFRANLGKLLPQISADIDKIPDKSAMAIGKVAAYVNTCLLGVD
jgi:hypothetical protein